MTSQRQTIQKENPDISPVSVLIAIEDSLLGCIKRKFLQSEATETLQDRDRGDALGELSYHSGSSSWAQRTQ